MKSHEVIDALKETYGPPAHALLEQVGDSTGYASRHLDAIVMSLYPSRGLALTGIEVKVTRNDWRNELKSPDKAEPIARFCDYFVVAAPKAVVPIEELPENWGLIEVNEKGKTRTVKQPVKLEADPTDRRFLAAVLRRAAASTPTWEMRQEAQKQAREAAEKELDIKVEYRVSGLSGELESLRRRVGEFEARTGLPLELHDAPRDYWGFPSGEELANAYLYLAKGGAKKLRWQISSLENVIRNLGEATGALKEVIDDDQTA